MVRKKNINVRANEETLDRLRRLAEVMTQTLGVEVSQADVIQAALVELEKKYHSAKKGKGNA